MASVETERAYGLWRAMWPHRDEPTIDDFRAACETFTAQFPVPDDVIAEPVDAEGVPALWARTPAATPTNRCPPSSSHQPTGRSPS